LVERSAALGRGAHAYLLTGAAHLGKRTTAFAIARGLLCPSASGCSTCRHCRLVERRAHPDLRVLEIPPDRKNIPIRDVHEFLQGLALRPLESNRKVYIIRGADDLAEDGGNALLKTLEEPPPAVVLLLTAPTAGVMLPTIVSRCQVLALRPVPSEAIAAYLVSVHGLEPGSADTAARASRGRPGWAIQAAQDPQILQEHLQRRSDLLGLLWADRLARIRHANGLADRWSRHAHDVRDVLDVWTDVWRDALLAQQGLEDRVQHGEVADDLLRVVKVLPEKHGPDVFRRMLSSTLETRDALDRNANPRLALETHILTLPRLP
ncbi:MAG: hypothetical protein GEU73_15800, partial [Chloroflexi bacterium]|nr:hypothetical protein [Chloroflexota bacterium]